LVIEWRGHGRFRRLLMGSVSRAVLRRAETPVLVVRRGSRRVSHLAVGGDGSAASDRAIRLRKAGWRVRGQVRAGAPLYELLRTVDETRADALVVGATSQNAPRQGLLRSTSEGAVNRSAVPVLVVP